MYAKLFQDRHPIAITDNTIYPCPSLAVPSPPFTMYVDEPVINNREYYKAPPPPPPQQKYRGPPSSRPIHNAGQDTLLPVLDCRFNLREICKQCILLEDHLSHERKRCTDCCIKHFLALEGLCEEAITLDKNGEHTQDVPAMIEKIRELQHMWYNEPDKNAHHCAQELRKLRKVFQTNVFPIIFDQDPKKENLCGGGVCRLKN
jgi:hypothetical protein